MVCYEDFSVIDGGDNRSVVGSIEEDDKPFIDLGVDDQRCICKHCGDVFRLDQIARHLRDISRIWVFKDSYRKFFLHTYDRTDPLINAHNRGVFILSSLIKRGMTDPDAFWVDSGHDALVGKKPNENTEIKKSTNLKLYQDGHLEILHHTFLYSLEHPLYSCDYFELI